MKIYPEKIQESRGFFVNYVYKTLSSHTRKSGGKTPKFRAFRPPVPRVALGKVQFPFSNRTSFLFLHVNAEGPRKGSKNFFKKAAHSLFSQENPCLVGERCRKTHRSGSFSQKASLFVEKWNSPYHRW